MFTPKKQNSIDVHIQALTLELAQYQSLLKEVFSQHSARFSGPLSFVAPEAKLELKHVSNGAVSRISTSLQRLSSAIKATELRLAILKKLKSGENVSQDELNCLMKVAPLAQDPAVRDYVNVIRPESLKQSIA